MSAAFARKDLHILAIYLSTGESTLEKSRMNVMFVRNDLHFLITCLCM